MSQQNMQRENPRPGGSFFRYIFFAIWLVFVVFGGGLVLKAQLKDLNSQDNQQVTNATITSKHHSYRPGPSDVITGVYDIKYQFDTPTRSNVTGSCTLFEDSFSPDATYIKVAYNKDNPEDNGVYGLGASNWVKQGFFVLTVVGVAVCILLGFAKMKSKPVDGATPENIAH